MKVWNITRLVALGALALVALGCGSGRSTPPLTDERPANELTFLRPATGAPQFADTTVRFYAKRGEDRQVRIRYALAPGSTELEEFVRFRVRPEALQAYPDGRPFAQGDSVLITVHVVDFARLIVEFEPSGLRFSAARPAELTFKYDDADHDFDGDGDIDADDRGAEPLLAVWRQEAPGQPWLKLTSNVEIELDEIEADLTGFSGYALAY
jgi:hypothetical protein